MKSLLLAFALCLAAGLANAAELLPITYGKTEEGHCFLEMGIDQVRSSEKGLSFVARGTTDGKVASVTFALGPVWNQLTTGTQYTGTATLTRDGVESTAFASVFGKALGKKSNKAIRAKVIELTAVFNGEPNSIGTSPAWIQFISGAAPSEGYTEFFIRLDLQKKTLRLQEVIPSLRDPLFQLFTKG